MIKTKINPQIRRIGIPVLVLIILLQGLWITGNNKSNEPQYNSYSSSPKPFTYTSILTISPDFVDYSVFTITADNQSII